MPLQSQKAPARPAKSVLGARKTHQAAARAAAAEPKQEQRAKRENAARRWRPGTVALREVRHYQQSVYFLIGRAPFRRLVKEMADKEKPFLRFTPAAIDAMQEAAEAHVVSIMADAVACAHHAKRVTLKRTDIELAMKLRGLRN